MFGFIKNAPDRPALTAKIIIAVQIVLWTLVPILTHKAPPLDVVEMYIWGREWVPATYKHPNLPGYILEGLRIVSFGGYWPAYLASQLCIVAAFWAVFSLGREMLDSRRALAGMVLLTAVYYYSLSGPEFNHNVVQIPLWAGIIVAVWRSVNTGKLLWWALLGVLAGLSMWAKYSSIILLAVAAIWILSDKKGRATLKTPGPWVTIALGLLTVAPQIHYLILSDFLPVTYATDRAGQSAAPFYKFPLTQALNHIVMLILLAATGLIGRKMWVDITGDARAIRARRFLLAFGLGPLMLSVLISVALGLTFKSMWGMPMFNLSGLLFVAFMGARLTDARLRKLTAGAMIILIALPLLYGAQKIFDTSGKPPRTAWPQQEISDFMHAEWAQKTGAPLHYVTGEYWTAGLVALASKNDPSVYIDADTIKAHWINPDDIKMRGTLVVWPTGPKKYDKPDTLLRFIDGYPVQTKIFKWSDDPDARPITLEYIIVPPAANQP